MKILLKQHSYNGASPVNDFNSVKDAERYLNEALYYSARVELSSSFDDLVEYDKNTKLSHLMQDAKMYGEGYINVYISYE